MIKNLTWKQLKLRRNLIFVFGTVVEFVIWFFIPTVIKNNSLFHVGNGMSGSKYGFLLFLGIPFFALCEKPKLPEHTTDPEEKAKLTEEALTVCYRKQFGLAAGESLAVILLMLGALLICS